jgi:hypothetical protein
MLLTLESIALPSTMVLINWESFCNCEKLKRIHINDVLRWIFSRAFAGCSSLEIIVLPSTVDFVDFPSEGIAFSPHLYPLLLTDKATEIFKGCSSLKRIVLPPYVKKIVTGAFKDCSSLEKIDLHEGLTEIRASAFEGCSSLESIVLPSSV